MNCQYCGEELGLTALVLGDRDFCSRRHREQYHARLRKGLNLTEDAAPLLAGSHWMLSPCDAAHSLPAPLQFVPACSTQLQLPLLAKDRQGLTEPEVLPTVDVRESGLWAGTERVGVNEQSRVNPRGLASNDEAAQSRPSVPGSSPQPAARDRKSELRQRLELLRADFERRTCKPNQYATA